MTDEAIHNLIHHPDFAFEVLKAMIAEREKNNALQAELSVAAPKAKYCDEILKSKSSIQTSIIAKDYGMSAVTFNRLLHVLGVQYRIGTTWLLYQDFADRGYTKTATFKIKPDKTVIQTYWTQNGRMFLYKLLQGHGILPIIETGDAHGKK